MAESHAWGTVTDKQSGSADPNVLKLDDQVRIRLIEPGAKKWRSHGVESAADPDQFRSVTCPRGPDGTSPVPCPLCMKPADEQGNQRFGISRRQATNVWVYNKDGSGGEIKVLIGGPTIFQEFDNTAKMGIDPTASDWTIFRMGQGKSTSYKLARHDSSPFQHQAEITPDKLHDLDKYADPPSVESIFKTLEELGIDYDSLEMPSFTLDGAESFQMPFGKHKGLTLEQLYANDRDYMLYIYNSKREQGSYGDPIFIAMHTLLEHHGEVAPLEQMPVTAPRPAATNGTAPAATDTVTLIGPDGSSVDVPAGAKDALLASGYTLPPEPEPPAAPQMVTLWSAEGVASEFPAAAKDGLLAAGFSESDPTAVASTPEPEQPSTVMMLAPGATEPTAIDPALVDQLLAAGFTRVGDEAPQAIAVEYTDDMQVAIEISGQPATMSYGQAKPLIDSGVATLVGPVSVEGSAVEQPQTTPEPDNDTQVDFYLKATKANVPMPYGDAKRLFLEGHGDFMGDQAADYQAFARAGQPDSDAEAKAQAEAAAAGDAHPPALSGSNYDPSLTVTNDDGTFSHPALEKKDYKTKGAVTQALNKAKSQQPAAPAASNGAPAATGTDALMDEVRNLLSQVPEISGDFGVLMKLFEETGGKRNIQEFDEAGLTKLKTKLQEKVAGAA